MNGMVIKPALVVPNAILWGLRTGEMRRRGGVVQYSGGHPSGRGGEIVTWLREADLAPQSSNSLLRHLTGEAASVLQLAGSAASVLNLGATVAFGVATLRKLKRIEGKLDQLDAKLDRIEWRIEVGFLSIQEQIACVSLAVERQDLAKLNSGATLAWTAQGLPPGSNERRHRMESALGQASEAREVLTRRATEGLENWKVFVKRHPRNGVHGRRVLLAAAENAVSVRRVGTAALSAALFGRTLAEQGQLAEAASTMRQSSNTLRSALADATRTWLRDTPDTNYDKLLSPYASKAGVTIERVQAWASRFDPEIGSAQGILQHLRTLTPETLGWGSEDFPNAASLGALADALDSAWEDCERLDGYAAEFEDARRRGLSVEEYRSLLAVDVDDLDGRLVLLVPETEPRRGWLKRLRPATR